MLIGLAALVALAAAVRSTWSPCGQSMLSTITPVTEPARGPRFATTAAWFVTGATVGGATLGALAAGLAALVGLTGLTTAGALAVGGFLALVAAASDARVLGFRLPGHIRQVNEDWLGRYRSWVYGAGFGWQIGTGLGTFIMTAAVYLLVPLVALTADPLAAVGLCALFGFARGLAVLPAGRC